MDDYFSERITWTVLSDDYLFVMDSPSRSNWYFYTWRASAIRTDWGFLKKITAAVRMAGNFSVQTASHWSWMDNEWMINGWQTPRKPFYWFECKRSHICQFCTQNNSYQLVITVMSQSKSTNNTYQHNPKLPHTWNNDMIHKEFEN